MVVLGDHKTETENLLQAQAMRLQLHKSPFIQELCHGGTWERNTDCVYTGETEVVSQCWDHNMDPQQGLPREASLEILKYPGTLQVQALSNLI